MTYPLNAGAAACVLPALGKTFTGTGHFLASGETMDFTPLEFNFLHRAGLAFLHHADITQLTLAPAALEQRAREIFLEANEVTLEVISGPRRGRAPITLTGPLTAYDVLTGLQRLVGPTETPVVTGEVVEKALILREQTPHRWRLQLNPDDEDESD